jgi:UrcA family protein
MTTSLKWLSSLAAATAVSLISLSSAAAEPAGVDAPTRTVKAWDLDLAKSDDVQTLYRRLQRAASELCTEEAKRHRLSTRLRAPEGWTERCVQEAVDTAVREADHRRLAAAHSPSTSTLL